MRFLIGLQRDAEGEMFIEPLQAGAVANQKIEAVIGGKLAGQRLERDLGANARDVTDGNGNAAGHYRSPIPKGLCPPAQGCEERATLGKCPRVPLNSEGVVP